MVCCKWSCDVSERKNSNLIIVQVSICNLTWYICVGNHDFGEGGNEWNQVELSLHEPRWVLPHLWYDFVEQVADHTVHFVVFDTQSFKQQINDYEARYFDIFKFVCHHWD